MKYDLTEQDRRLIRFLAYVPARTERQLVAAIGCTPETVESLWRRGLVVRRVRFDGQDDIHFASLSGVQEAMAGTDTLPETLQWQYADKDGGRPDVV